MAEGTIARLVDWWVRLQVVQVVGILFLVLACPAAMCALSVVMRLTHNR